MNIITIYSRIPAAVRAIRYNRWFNRRHTSFKRFLVLIQFTLHRRSYYNLLFVESALSQLEFWWNDHHQGTMYGYNKVRIAIGNYRNKSYQKTNMNLMCTNEIRKNHIKNWTPYSDANLQWHKNEFLITSLYNGD